MSNYQPVATPSAASQRLPDGTAPWPPELLGDSASMRRVRERLREAAAGRGRVLLLVDRGFDAERIARHLHEIDGTVSPFLTVDCAQEEAAALERLLFGTRSYLASAKGGTLYLARITEMAESAQARLARALRDGELSLDDGRRETLDLRVVAAAAPNVDEDVEDGRLRADLYRRLAANRIQVPALRERPEDIATLAVHLAEIACRQKDNPARAFTHAALASLAALPWSGNLVELRERIERLCAAVDPGPIRAEDVLADVRLERRAGAASRPGTLRDARRHFEREYIAAVLTRHGWRIAEAAATLGIERANLYRKIRQVGLSRPTSGGSGGE
jgi:two-component system nitrogen regulation response regulator NtrX